MKPTSSGSLIGVRNRIRRGEILELMGPGLSVDENIQGLLSSPMIMDDAGALLMSFAREIVTMMFGEVWE